VVSKINHAARTVNATTRTFGVEILLDNKKEYHPNSVARVKINDYRSPKPVLVLPAKYIQKSNGEIYTLVAENGKAVKKNLIIGKEYRGCAEILSGLHEGEMIITEGYDMVVDGDNVKVRK